jgi:hypothetical protein
MCSSVFDTAMAGQASPLFDIVSTVPTMSITLGIVLVLLTLARKGNLDINPIIDALAEWIRLPVDLIKTATSHLRWRPVRSIP